MMPLLAMGVIVRGLLLLAAVLFLVLPFRAVADGATAATTAADTCILKNKEFCGVWEPMSTRSGGGNLIVTGDRLTWENGDRSECVLVDEDELKGSLFFAVRCRETFFTGRIDDPVFYLLHRRRDQNKLFMVSGHSTECLILGLHNMVTANDTRMREIGSPCGGFSTFTFFRSEP